MNYFGTTAASTTLSLGTVSAGQVVDVTISPVAGAMQYNIYIEVSSAWYLWATCGGVKYTIQGPTPGTSVTPPATDTGTGKGTRMEGIVPVLTGVSASAGIYPSGWQGGYVNNAVGAHMNYNAIYNALKALWDSTSTSPGAFKADPAEIISCWLGPREPLAGRDQPGHGGELRAVHLAARGGRRHGRRCGLAVPEPADQVADQDGRPPLLPAGER